MHFCADVLRNVSSMPVDRDTLHVSVLNAYWVRKYSWNRVSRQMCSACCNWISLFRTSDEEYWPQVLSFFMTTLGRIMQLQQRGSLSVFDGKCFYHPPSSARTWFPVIFISFLVWDGRRRTTFWHSELQTSIENWQKKADGFYDEGTGKLVPCYEKMSTSERRLCREVAGTCG